STNRQEADLCSAAARRARHRMCRVHPTLSAIWFFTPTPKGGSRTHVIKNDGFDKSAGSRFLQRSRPKGEAQDVPSTSPPLRHMVFPPNLKGWESNPRKSKMTGSTNRQEADLCSAAARRARHRMCRVHPTLSAIWFFTPAPSRAPQPERFAQLLHTRRGVEAPCLLLDGKIP